MATIYSEFDSTPATLVADLRAKILTSSDWADITPTGVLLNTSVGPAAGATTLTFTSTTGFPLVSGDVIAIDTAGAREYRIINTVTATTITLTVGLTSAHSVGVGIYPGSVLLKATTTRGAQMVIDLMREPSAVNYQCWTAWRTHTGAVGGGVDELGKRYLYHRPSGGGLTMPIHVTVSASKEHLFVAVEGTRAHETTPYSAGWGGSKTYLFLCDMVPYHAADTIPAVVVAGPTGVQAASWTNNAHQCWVSRAQGNAASWVNARLHTLTIPDWATNLNLVGYQPEAAGDGKYYVFPYVVIEEIDGLRGRLSDLFFAGYNNSLYSADVLPAVGRRITYGGKTYKLTQVNKSEPTSQWRVWNVLGGAGNGGGAEMNTSPVVAIPYV